MALEEQKGEHVEPEVDNTLTLSMKEPLWVRVLHRDGLEFGDARG